MKQFSSDSFIVEPLECRIAPASIIYAGGPGQGSVLRPDQEYSTVGTPFHHTTVPDGISSVVGGTNTYYLILNAGDTLKVFNNSSGYQDLISVSSGSVVAFFYDNAGGSPDGVVQASELSGLSLSKGAAVVVSGNVNGDIVTNYDPLTQSLVANMAVDTINHPGFSPQTQTIAKLSVGGNVTGNIISGGSITTVSVAGNVNGVVVGTAASGQSYDFNGGDTGGGSTTAFAWPAKVTGASVLKANVGSITTSIQAGDGGSGAVGGSLSNITITGDSDGFILQAGNGGGGTASSTTGGAGGSITNVIVAGADPSSGDLTSNDTVLIQAGNGGAAFTGGTGGAGGKVTGVYFGYQMLANSTTPSATNDPLKDDVFVLGGAGGNGKTGGVGGALSNINVISVAPNAGGNEISIIGGTGGNGVGLGSKGGAGGALTTISAQEWNTTSVPSILVQGGAGGGGAATGGDGGAGGSVSAVSLVGHYLTVMGGNGANGANLVGIATKGGAGGNVTGVTIGRRDSIIANYVTIDGGAGGNTGTGISTSAVNGGNGGAIQTIRALNVDVSSFNIVSGSGGNSVTGVGGIGGAISDIIVNDTIYNAAGNATIVSGNGGNGAKGGGAAGSISGTHVETALVNFIIAGGTGGSATTAGKGGVGGSILGSDFQSYDKVSDVTATITAGTGGNGASSGTTTGAGGNGGAISQTNVIVDGFVTLTAGTGGNGAGTNAGAGGSIISAVAISKSSDATILAGSAGSVGAKGAVGGSITSSQFEVSGNLTVTAGAGSLGGAGGNIGSVGYSGFIITDNVTGAGVTAAAPSGDIIFNAGIGSVLGTTAGKGGSISSITGYASSSAGGLTEFIAGDGLGGTVKGSDGGSISGINLVGGGHGGLYTSSPNQVIIKAGDGGNTVSGTTGSKGGNVQNVSIGNLASGTLVRSIAAGNGGSAPAGTGGLGGSVSGVNVQGDIGEVGLRGTYTLTETYSTTADWTSGTNLLTVDPLSTVNGTSIPVDFDNGFAVGEAITGTGIQAGTTIATISFNFTTSLYEITLSKPTTASGSSATITITGTTAPINYNASPKQVEDALNAVLLTAAEGGVTVSGALGGPIITGIGGGAYTITFNNDGAGSLLAADVSNFTLTAPMTVAETQAPSFSAPETQTILINTPTSHIENYGYSTMGGIFAGAGGSGLTNGLAGNVTNVTANAIASIVAGRASAPSLVTSVSGINLSGLHATHINSSTHAYDDYTNANLVGAVVDPFSSNGSVFKFTDTNSNSVYDAGEVPIDGLIAAITISNKNFVPEAFLTKVNGVLTLIPDIP